MTTKDLRDIAAYCFSDAPIEHYPCFQVDPSEKWQPLDEISLPELYRLAHDDKVNLTGFKLHLRPISSLTDEELKQCYIVDSLTPVEIQSVDWWGIRHYKDKVHVNGLCLTFSGKFYRFTPAFPNGNIGPLNNPGAVIAYLQSIAVYVPGTIDEKYVQLT